jgi:Uma2 family endonuclease
MEEPSFESVEYVSQERFARWVAKRAEWDPLNRYELLNGRIIVTPPAGYPHGSAEASIVAKLRDLVDSRHLGYVFASSQGYELPTGDTLAADATFISRARWEAGPAPEEGKYLRIVPDLVVEVLSAKTASRDRGEKKAIYERNGVREYWLVDTRGQRITRFVRRDDRFDLGTVYAGEERLESEVLTGFGCPVSELLALPPPPAP